MSPASTRPPHKLRIGVLSDTHGLLRPQVFEALDGVDRILHAGDVGAEEILRDLEAIAPVEAVSGNMDGFSAGLRLPERRVVRLGEILAFLTHIVDRPDRLAIDHPEARRCRVVVYGHTHRPHQEERNGVLFLNPGSCGPRRFSLPVTVALLTVEGDSVRAEIVDLST